MAAAVSGSPSPAAELEIFRGAPDLDLTAVESELRNLWKRASEEHAGEGRPPVTRVGTMNLLALAPESTLGERALGELLEVSAHHPGRILLVETVAEPGVRAEASAHCHLRAGGGQVCSEIVRLWVGRTSAGALPQIVASLLVPDLSVVLWIPGVLSSAPVASDLLRLVDRVIVDSRLAAGTAEHLDLLGEWSEAARAGLSDLAWHRLERWRALTAQVFEEEAARRELPELCRVEVEYLEAGVGEPSGCVEALYFAAWMARRLGCEPIGREAGKAGAWRARRSDGGTLLLDIEPRRREHENPGDLIRVRLATERGSRYEIARSAGHRTATLRVERAGACPEPVAVGLLSATQVEALRAALERRRPDRLFVETLDWLRALLGRSG